MRACWNAEAFGMSSIRLVRETGTMHEQRVRSCMNDPRPKGYYMYYDFISITLTLKLAVGV